MARILDTELEASLEKCTVHTTLRIELAAGDILRLASAELLVNEDGNDESYSGKLNVTDALRMTLTDATDRMNVEIDNAKLILGQALINQPGAFEKSFAMIGAYFKNPFTTQEWHDDKIPGEVTTAEINGDTIPIYFLSELDAADYNGDAIADAFPDSQNTPAIPAPVNDVYNPTDYMPEILKRKLDPVIDDYQTGRYYLPDTLRLY